MTPRSDRRRARVDSLGAVLILIVGVALALAIPAIASGAHVAGGGASIAFAPYSEPVLPQAATDAGFVPAIGSTSRTQAGRHLLTDDPYGCATGADWQVLRDGICYQVPRE